MPETFEQTATGDKNIQAGRDVISKTFNIYRASTAETIHAIDGYLALFYLSLVVSLAATMLPSAALNVIASIGTLGSAALVGLLHWERRRLSRSSSRGLMKFQVAAAALLILSGCSGAQLADLHDQTLLQLIHQYKTGSAQGVGLFGLGLEDITAEAAMMNGNIEKVYASESVRSFGIISVARVTVYGE
ncbi:hypothetical protein DSOUD_0829 [Desulfuromonas soudanensis]|uniref:Uncharacterized protein n=1 Tax=Desulfuromonas soudanensis TaxID=1603606 RepID=A0A0M4CV89_9BACT|nr:hypothetical protein [Desulfuromonas soudanensis]ALC15616.1 hypothetical protein DSOUD_0829 [Desulfuromonas soudanensis]